MARRQDLSSDGQPTWAADLGGGSHVVASDLRRPSARVMICVGFRYLRAQPRRSVELLLRTPAATAATRRDCGRVRSLFRLTACTRGPFFRAGAQ